MQTQRITPYPYQREAVQTLLDNRAISDRALIVMASGLGKSVTMALFVQAHLTTHPSSRILFLCHNNDILEHCRGEFRKVLDDHISIGLFHGGEKEFESVTVLFASLQTMRTWRTAFFPDEFDIVIVDEGHHGQAVGFRKTIGYFQPGYLIGVTATPDRMDGKDIRDLFGPEIFSLSLPDALAKGYLTRVEYRVVTDNTDRKEIQKLYDEVVGKGVRVTIRDLNRRIFVRPRDARIVEIIRENRQRDEQTIIFCPSVEYANYLCATFFKHDGAPYHASLPREVATRNYRDFKSGVIRILLVVDKFNEGVNIPGAELIVFLRSTSSRTIWLQQLGRGLRKGAHKDAVTVLDFVANCQRIFDIRHMLVPEINGAAEKINALVIEQTIGKFFFSIEATHILSILERLYAIPYETIEGAMRAVRQQNIANREDYKLRRRIDQRLPGDPSDYYRNKGWVSWPHFLGKEAKNFYETLEEAMEAVQVLGIRNQMQYGERYKNNLRLPANPDRAYKNKGWVSWPHFLGKEAKNFYETLEEAGAAARSLGIRSASQYIKERKKDQRLPSSPERTYKNKGWISWPHFLGKEYKSFAEASEIAQQFKISSMKEYRKWHKKQRHEYRDMPANPNHVYKNKGWVSWPHFLGKEGLYKTLEMAMAAVQKLEIHTCTQYSKKCEMDPQLPSRPEDTYKNKGWVSWTHFLGKEVKNFYATLEEAGAAAQALGIRSAAQYMKEWKKDQKLPSNPERTYKNKGWVSWPHFLGKEVKNFYATLEEAGAAARSLGIKTNEKYNLEYSKDPRLPSHPERIYRNKGWVSWTHFLKA